ncbi:P-loop containing nucleoside triphosphate hydrolase protein [Lentinus tigrinus ALCF2SS1-7]|uniref:P-loop containing nucleoside triphosphate hydrolase protein n=1 Tax=Lentinus tigrinus ALCF2SS1-6 TaxID=1328759 RepID=A0A5C2RYT6_9APHY|nr:P-loop containing nucleoside triphosphate hydrolase protein [Lentinus tigrinus ALCF2SS1-6]RPD71023.1 P-loop containing nucleoside triphosphate hydrolase protein [Lentinus tigrinus ALCF2SS1-7]
MANCEKGASGSDVAHLNDSSSSSVAKIQKWKGEGRIVKHTRIGVWDEYVEVDPDAGRMSITATVVKKYEGVLGSVPYLVRIVKDVLGIPGCKLQTFLFVGASLGTAVVPAATLWLEGQLVKMIEGVIETRTIDTHGLLLICAGRLACTFAQHALTNTTTKAENTLNARIRRWFSQHQFGAYARLDVPTYGLTDVQSKLEASADDYFDRTVVWQTLKKTMGIVSSVAQLGGQAYVLMNALKGQKDGLLLVGVTMISHTVPLLSQFKVFAVATAWAVRTRNKDYVKMCGWKKAIRQEKHRKEIVAGNLVGYATSEFKAVTDRLGDDNRTWYEVSRSQDAHINAWTIVKDVFAHLPQIAFTISAFRRPANMPESLAALGLVQSAASSFAWSVYEMVSRTNGIEEQIQAVRNVYELADIPNVVSDGTVAFPENGESIEAGIALEFRNVSFKYPDTDNYALRDISFRLLPGQLCVIVGSNGAGKSTILKLIVRVYDPEEGAIFIGGHDIRTLKLSDLRRAISVLFQDYTHFPLSIRDNIALGDPTGSGDESHVRQAARLGGAESFIEKLSDGFETYLEPPAVEYCIGPTEGSKSLSGKPFDVTAVRDCAGMKTTTKTELSGGQMQRLAVSRTFMRSIVREEASEVGLLLFDEPSASLDPAAEHDLFDRLCELRGNKTMVFSSHRFGNLTRHADLILYMNESGIVESGTHHSLLEAEGEYARLWKLQAQAFI